MTAPVIPDGFTREELIACVERELRLRERVYPRQVDLGKMSRAKADEERRAMGAILAVLRQLPATPAVQPELPMLDVLERLGDPAAQALAVARRMGGKKP